MRAGVWLGARSCMGEGRRCTYLRLDPSPLLRQALSHTHTSVVMIQTRGFQDVISNHKCPGEEGVYTRPIHDRGAGGHLAGAPYFTPRVNGTGIALGLLLQMHQGGQPFP